MPSLVGARKVRFSMGEVRAFTALALSENAYVIQAERAISERRVAP